MPVTGNEEIGIKPVILRQTSDYLAGIPIKKRRYPMIRPPSPPVEEPSSTSPVDSNSLQKDQTSPSHGSSSSLSEVIKSVEPGERKESSPADEDGRALKGNTGFSEVKVEEPSSVRTGSLGNLDKGEKSVVANNPTNEIVLGRSESNSEASESLVLNGKQTVEVKVEAKTSELLEKPGSLSRAKDHSDLVLPSKNSVGSDKNQDSPEPISLNLSLSKQVTVRSPCKTDVVDGINVGSSYRPCEDRANWDLNRPMDAWVGPLSALALGQTSLSGRDGQTQDVNPLIPAAPVSVAPEKRVDTERTTLNTLSILPNLSGAQVNSEDSLRLRLSPSLQFSGTGQSTPRDKLNTDKVIPNAKIPRAIVLSRNSSMVTVGAVKAEPVDECIKQGVRGAETSKVAVTDSVASVKRELVDKSRLEAPIALDRLTQKSVDAGPVKPEPVLESNRLTTNSKEGNSLHLNESMVQLPDKYSSAVAACTASKTLCSAGNSSCLTEYERSHGSLVLKTAETSSASGSSLSTECKHKSAEATCNITEITCPAANSSAPIELLRCESRLSNSGQPSLTNRRCLKRNLEAGESGGPVGPDTGSTLTSVEAEVARAEVIITDNSEERKSKPPTDLPPPSRGSAFGSGSEEEKVNISAEIEVSYGSDYESDGSHAMDMSVDMEIDIEEDYEDGEVRESQELVVAKESVCETEQLEHANNNDLNTGAEGTLEVNVDTNPSSSNAEVRYDRTYTAETGKDADGASKAVHGEKCETGSDRSLYLQDPTTVGTPLGGALMNETNKAVVQSPLDQSGNRIAQEYEERDSKQVANGGMEPLPSYLYGTSWSMNEDGLVSKNDVSLAKSVTTGVDNDAKDIDNASQRSRIIHLPRSSGSSSPSGAKAFSGRLLPPRTGRERLSDFAVEGDKIHSRGREDIYCDGTQKFARERHRDPAPRNTRFGFMRGRGRISNRHDNLRGDRESDREFASEYYNGPSEFRVPRHKFASSVSDADLEYNSYNVSQDVGFVGSGRGGRKPLNNGGGQFVRRMPARRRSPGAPSRGAHVVRRMSRNISPSRCVAEEGSELVRPRRNGRGFQDNNMDPMYSHPQPSYEAVDGHFAQGNRSFPSSQRRVMHRIRSKSPVGSRTRSPGAWPSPRRRSPDGFAGHPDLNHQRSPPFYRMERMKSPDRRGFPGEGVVRRQDMRDVDSGRDNGGQHPGSGMPNSRSPSNRIVIRERRFGGLDPQERSESGDFYGGPMNSSRLHELAGDANGDERRFSERRGPVRPYRNSFNGAEGESFHGSSEDGSRQPLRFCPDDNTEFQDRGNNMVERDFNRRIKNRPVNAPRRMRNVDEQEVNYRHGNQSWHNNDFDEMSRVKRKRY